MKYEKPALEELDLMLEGSFLDYSTTPKDPDPFDPTDPGDSENPDDIWG